MIIDKEGRLFGKVSIIDIITLILVVLIGFLFLKQLGVIGSKQVAVSLDQLEITFYQEEVNDFTAESVQIGQPTKETLKNVSFGEITKIEIGDPISWDKDPDGKQVSSSREGYKSIYITTETKGRLTENGALLAGEEYYVGQTIMFKAGNAIFYGDIAGFNKK